MSTDTLYLGTARRDFGGPPVLEEQLQGWLMSDEALRWAKSTVWSRAFNVKFLGKMWNMSAVLLWTLHFSTAMLIASMTRMRVVVGQGRLARRALHSYPSWTCWITDQTSMWHGTPAQLAQKTSSSSPREPLSRCPETSSVVAASTFRRILPFAESYGECRVLLCSPTMDTNLMRNSYWDMASC